MRRFCPGLNLTFVSYSVGAQTIREWGMPCIDLDLPEENPVVETLCRAAAVMAARQPRLIVSHEEFAALPAARILGIGSIFLVDWFMPSQSFLTQCMSCAGEVIFLDEPAIYDEPAELRSRVRYAGAALRAFGATKQDRQGARAELDLAGDGTVVCILPGGASASAESQSPTLPLIAQAVALLPGAPATVVCVSAVPEACAESIPESLRDRWKFLAPRKDIDRIMVACDAVITKGTRMTTLELNALGVPSISISHGLNPVDDHRIPFVPTNIHLRARGLTPEILCSHLTRALAADFPGLPPVDANRGTVLAAQMILERVSPG